MKRKIVSALLVMSMTASLVACGNSGSGSSDPADESVSVETLEESAFDSLVNEINSQTTDVIVSGLAGTRQDRFVLENSSKISAKIWLSLGFS